MAGNFDEFWKEFNTLRSTITEVTSLCKRTFDLTNTHDENESAESSPSRKFNNIQNGDSVESSPSRKFNNVQNGESVESSPSRKFNYVQNANNYTFCEISTPNFPANWHKKIEKMLIEVMLISDSSLIDNNNVNEFIRSYLDTQIKKYFK
jgi:hypothetical protein